MIAALLAGASALLAAAIPLLAAAAVRPARGRRPPPATAMPIAMPTARQRASARRRAIERTYPDALDGIVLAVRAGYLPAAALEVALPHLPPVVRPAFAEVVARMHEGHRFADALAALPAALGPTATPLADCFAAADRYGQPLAPVLERLAAEARQLRRRNADALARQLPVRLSLPLVLCTLPAFVLLAVVPLLLSALSSLHH